MDIIPFLQRNGIKWQPVLLDNKRPLRFSDGTKPDPQEMRRMSYTHPGDDGKPVLSHGEMRRRQEEYTMHETSYIWVDTTEVNIIDIDKACDRNLAANLPQAKSTGKNLPHAFVRKLNAPLSKTTAPMGQSSELLCGQPAIQAVSDTVQQPQAPWERQLELDGEDATVDDFDDKVEDLDPQYLSVYRSLRNIAGACINLGVAKEKVEAVMPDNSPYPLNSAWKAGSKRLGLATLKLYGKTEYAENEQCFERWRDAFELYFFKLTHDAQFGLELDEGGHILYTKQKFMDAYSHWGPKHVKQWCNGADKRRYDRVDYLPPPLKCPETVFNSWSPFWFEAHDPVMYTVDGSGSPTDVEIFERFIRILAGGPDAESLGLLRGFLGHIITEPGKLPHKLPIIYSGVQGIGKTTFFEHVMPAVLGSGACCTEQLKTLFNTFSTQRAETLLCFVDEVTQMSTLRHRDSISSHVTADKVRQEAKFVTPYYVKNTSRMVIATNDNQVMSISRGDRRYIVFQAERTTEDGEIEELMAAIKDRTRLLAFVSYLRDHAMASKDISTAKGPENLAVKSMRCTSKNKEITRWLEHVMDENKGKIAKRVWSRTDVNESMRNWAATQPDSSSLLPMFQLRRDANAKINSMIDTWYPHVQRITEGNNNYKGKILFDWVAINKAVREDDEE